MGTDNENYLMSDTTLNFRGKPLPQLDKWTFSGITGRYSGLFPATPPAIVVAYAYTLAKKFMAPQIDRIHASGDVTVVIWKDGTKTLVRRGENDTYSLEHAVAMAFMKKLFGSHSAYKKHLRKVVVVPKKAKGADAE